MLLIYTINTKNNIEIITNIRYYKITKDTNIYNSYFSDGHFNSSTGTPYYTN